MTQRHATDIVFLSGRRTPFGTFGGSLRGFTAVDLGVHAAKAAIESAGIDATAVQHVIFGNAFQTTTDTVYMARHVGLRVGVPVDVPMLTVNRLCGSGFQAIVSGAQEIMLDQADVVLCGGAESMSQAPHVVRGARWGDLRLGETGNAFEDTLWASLLDGNCGLSMAQTAEKLADEKGVTRADADLVAYRSQQRATAGWDAGHFAAEVSPVPVKTRKGEVLFERDEHIRSDTTLEGLAKLRPYFRKDGVVTAGNASGIGDGAAAVVISRAEWAAANGAKPIGRLVSWGVAGVPPEIMGIGPVPSSRKALEVAGLSLEDMDLVEVNEAFAPQYAAVEKELGLDPEKTNVNGGAIALTHPLAASGARITVHLLHELRRRGGRLGLGSACIGGGQGMAVIVEAIS
ncbi:MAG: acetyl-CoA C-acyltransferase [Gemmatimonadota bacterium]|jgi:acetyl-CoA acyltransferase 2